MFLLLCLSVNAQIYEETDSIVNIYQKVRDVNTDRVKVWDVSGFNVEDKVLIIQMKGVTILPDGTVDLLNETGKYEIVVVDDILSASDEIVFRTNLFNFYDPAECVQVVRLAEYEHVRFNNEVTAPAWNDSTGGIVAILAKKSIDLQNNINVSGKGFKGGDPNLDPDYNGDCFYTSSVYQQPNYEISEIDRAGRKGEGMITDTYTKNRGYAKILNAGGGGNARFSGGGGGAGYGTGGDGGYEGVTCSSVSFKRANPGEPIPFFYENAKNRVVFGGGGGTSNQNKSQGFYATRGGNGGGIVFLITETLIGNNDSIIANGQSVTDIATAGAGGGGGGGSILIDVISYSGITNLVVNGGDGGHTVGVDSTGPGGGGGGGIIWHSGSSLPTEIYNNVSWEKGIRGRSNNANRGANSGSDGGSLQNLFVQFNGFLFNTIVSNDTTICEGTQVKTLIASQPRGGDGTYSYQWQSSLDSVTWTNIGTIANTLTYDPGILTDTTYFRRIVTSDVLTDTSKIMTVFVHDAITGNAILADATICQGQSPDTLIGTGYTGGDRSVYYFQWKKKSIADTEFSNISEGGSSEKYKSPNLYDTTCFKRTITSGVCASESNEVEIIVLPTLSNDSIFEDQDVCSGETALQLTGTQPANGDGVNYNYTWEESTNGTNWVNATGTNNLMNYQPPFVTDTMFYRRQVTSGPGDVCTSTSNMVEIDVLNVISGNTILEDDTLCSGTAPNLITGTPLSGGNGTYSYYWESSINGINWDSVPSGSSTLSPDPLTVSTYYRRTVYSGKNNVCSSLSNTIFFTILENIANNTIASSQVMCENEIPATLTGGDPVGGTAQYDYTWQIKPSTGNWANTEGINSDKDYTFDNPLNPGNYYIRRYVKSDVCDDYSDSIKIEVQSDITGNSLNTPDAVCYGDSPGIISSGVLSGGDNSYNYRWESGTDTLSVSEVTGVTTAGYPAPGIESPTFYRRKVTSGACADTSGFALVGITERPTGFLADDTDTICLGGSFDLAFSLSGQSNWDIYVDTGGEKLSTSSSATDYAFTITPTETATYTIDSIVDATGCKATDFSGEVLLTVNVIPIANAGDDTEICGLSHTLDANDDFPGRWVYNPDTINSISLNNAKSNLESSKYGQTSLYWISENGKCKDTAKVKLTFYEPPEVPSAGNDTVLKFEYKITLSATEATTGIGTWTSTNENINFSDINDPQSLVYLDTDSINQILTWTVINGVCPAVSDDIYITVDKLNPPQGFSPNNDGINDSWEVRGLLGKGIDDGSTIILKIFNSAGQLVYNNDEYKNEWEGTNNDGEDLTEGTYFFMLEVNQPINNDILRKGFVVIKR